MFFSKNLKNIEAYQKSTKENASLATRHRFNKVTLLLLFYCFATIICKSDFALLISTQMPHMR